MAILVAYALYEAWAFFFDRPLITTRVRAGIRSYPGWAFAAALVIGLLAGHFLWT